MDILSYPIPETGIWFQRISVGQVPIAVFVLVFLVLQVEISIGTLDDRSNTRWSAKPTLSISICRFCRLKPLFLHLLMVQPPTSQSTSRSPRGFQARPRQPRPNMSRRHPAASRSYCSPWRTKNQGNSWRPKDRVQGKKYAEHGHLYDMYNHAYPHS